MNDIEQYLDGLQRRKNYETLATEYVRAYELISRLAVWFHIPEPLQASTHQRMAAMCNAFVETAHDPYEIDDFE